MYIVTGVRPGIAGQLSHIEWGFTNAQATDWLIRPHVTDAAVIRRFIAAGGLVYAALKGGKAALEFDVAGALTVWGVPDWWTHLPVV